MSGAKSANARLDASGATLLATFHRPAAIGGPASADKLVTMLGIELVIVAKELTGSDIAKSNNRYPHAS